MFENIVLRRIFEPKRKEVTSERKKLHEKPKLSVFLPNIVRVNKSRMRWVGHVAFMGEWRGVYRVWW